MHRNLAALAFAPFLVAAPALAGPAADAVRFFYDHPGVELEAQNRDRFTGPARAFLDANDRSWEENGEVCLDFSFAIDGQDFDEEEVAGTLVLGEAARGAGALVTASFSLFGEPRSVEWSLALDGGAWKVEDVAAPGSGWRLSEFSCG